MKKCLPVIICFALFLPISTIVCFPAGQASASLVKADRVVVIKRARKLVLYKDGSVLKTYKVALGKNPVGPKVREGDRRTPEGKYLLDRRKADSKYYRALHISYPNDDDLEKARELGVPPGSNIMIHGLPKGYDDLGEWHTTFDWTKGCIAVTNKEIDEIWTLVPDGTPIEIRP